LQVDARFVAQKGGEDSMKLHLPPDSTTSFIWATGIENTFVPQTRAGMRSLDEYALTQHYEFWRSDFDLVAETGVQALR
jgi:hypothetical protein